MIDVRVMIATGCQLCPAAVTAVAAACAARGLSPTIVNIDGVLELERRYRAAIPVVEVDGAEVGRYVITEGEVGAALDRSSS